jgi:hypothetical protein
VQHYSRQPDRLGGRWRFSQTRGADGVLTVASVMPSTWATSDTPSISMLEKSTRNSAGANEIPGL